MSGNYLSLRAITPVIGTQLSLTRRGPPLGLMSLGRRVRAKRLILKLIKLSNYLILWGHMVEKEIRCA